MRYRHWSLAIVCGLAALLVALMGCAGYAQPGQSVSDHGLPPPITLADTSPAHLSVAIGVTIGGYEAATGAITEIAIQFLSNGRLVQFIKGETLSCNGGVPIHLTTGYDQQAATATVANTLYTCRYTSSHDSATIQFRVPSAPMLLSPAEGASVVRSSVTQVRFQALGALEGIVALGTQSKAIARVIAPGVATVDTSQFAAGAGSIALTQFPAVTDAAASAFASLHVNCTAIAQIAVTWT